MPNDPDILTVAREVLDQLNEAYRQGVPEQAPYEYDPHSNTSTLTAGKIERLAQAVIDLSVALEELWDFFEGGDPSEGVKEGDWAAMVKDIERQYHERGKHVGAWARDVCRLRKQLEDARAALEGKAGEGRK